jgi:ABC-2 type transport system permease protein
MRVLDLALKDIRQILRERRSAIFLVLMPLVFTAFMGLAFRWQTENDPRSAVGFIDLDAPGGIDRMMGMRLRNRLDSSGTTRLVPFTAAETVRVNDEVRRSHLDAAVIVPVGFHQRALRDSAVSLVVICDPGSPDGQAALRAIEAVVSRLRSAVEIARITQGGQAEEMPGAIERAVALWRDPAFTLRLERLVGGPLAVKRKVASGFNQSSPGILVQFLIFGLMTSAMIIVQERKTRTMQRLLTTSISRAGVIAGHLLATFAITFMQGLLLVFCGQFLFHVSWMSNPPAVLLVLVMLAFWVASLGLFIGVAVKSEEQVSLWSLISMFLFSGMGGAWFPLEFTGKTFSAIGHLLPSAWAMDGFQNIILRGLGMSSVLLPAAMLFGYGVLFLSLAIIRFRPEV